MKYAHEVIDLLTAYPDHSFRMNHIVRHVLQGQGVRRSITQRNAVRMGVHRVIQQLVQSGQIIKQKRTKTSAIYKWRKTVTSSY